MSAGVALDASVVVKLVLAEEDSDRAQALYQQTLGAHLPIIAPPLVRGEVANAIYQRRRRGDITQEEAEGALERFLAFPIQVIEPDSLYSHAFALARQFSLASIYDATYVALAQLSGLGLWTADQRLLNTLSGAAPWVRRIGDYQT